MQNKYQDAEPLLNESLEYSIELFGNKSENTQGCRLNLAVLYFKLNIHDKCRKIISDIINNEEKGSTIYTSAINLLNMIY